MKKIHFKEIDSTNSYAKSKIGTDEFRHGTMITADTQTNGRGRHGKSFASKGGMYLSVMLDARYPDYPFTMAAAVAVREAITELCEICPQIKWVNDLFWQNKKICGILTETKIENGRASGFVCGIGVNTKNTVIPEELSDIAETIPYSNNSLLAETITKKLIFMYENNINPIEKYKEGLILNKVVCAYKNNEFLFEGIAVDINENGNLIINSNGKLKILNSGEISIKL